MPQERIADIQVIQDGTQPHIRVTVPKGTTFEETIKLRPHLSDLVGKLKGCNACNSGVPIFIHEREEIANAIRVNLATMKKL